MGEKMDVNNMKMYITNDDGSYSEVNMNPIAVTFSFKPDAVTVHLTEQDYYELIDMALSIRDYAWALTLSVRKECFFPKV